MSIINKMLQELDRRHAGASPQGQAPHPEVRAVSSMRSGHEWFWRSVAALMLIAAGWTLWVVYQLQPRSVATELAYRAAENTRRRAPIAPAPVVEPAPMASPVAAPVTAAVAATTGAPETPSPASVVPASPAPAAPTPAPERLAAPIETLRLALTIDTPLAPRTRRPTKVDAAKVVAPSPSAVRPVRVARQADVARPAVEKRDREGAPADRAEAEYRRAAALLNAGRVTDAEEALLAALSANHAHQPARQTLIALYIEQRRIEEARRHLQEGLAVNPSYAPFAVALARIHVDRGEYVAALAVLDQAKAAGSEGSADFHALRGAVLQRLSRHGEAADAYRQALATGAQTGASWIGLGISLEALNRRPEAAEAFRRGIATGTLTGDLLAYAEQRVQQLR
jgi:MSHA biogenesis protein MshN